MLLMHAQNGSLSLFALLLILTTFSILFLDRVFAGKELDVDFGGKMRIVPNKCGKEVVRGRND